MRSPSCRRARSRLPRSPTSSFGEALYYAYQERWFDALQRLDAEIAQHYAVDEPELDSLYPYIGHAEFSVGDLELHYRMHHRAGRAIKAVLEADVPDPIRNEAAYRLARIHFQKGQHTDGLRALDGMRGEVPKATEADVGFLRANLYMAVGRPTDAAEVLRDLQGEDELEGFSTYNLGIALLQGGEQRDALRQLARAGRVRSRDGATLAIRDKSNLVLGTLYFDAGAFGPAQKSLDRVRLSVRSRTRRSCAPAGPTRRRATSAARSCRGTSCRSARRPTRPSRKRCSPCPTRTASSACTGAPRRSTGARSGPSATSSPSWTPRSGASDRASS